MAKTATAEVQPVSLPEVEPSIMPSNSLGALNERFSSVEL